MARYYFDTSIWLDIYEARGHNGEVAKKLLAKIIAVKDTVLYSDIILMEFKKLHYSYHEVVAILAMIHPHYRIHIHTIKSQRTAAKQLANRRNVPLGDALHAILAHDHEAQFVSRDHHFAKLKDITNTKLPEDLL